MASPALGIPRRVLEAEDLAAWPVVAQYPDTVHAQLQAAWFHRAGFAMQHAVLANSFAVVGEMVQAGLGIALMPVRYYAPQVRAGRLVKLRTTPELPNVKYFAVWRRTPAHRLAAPVARLAKGLCDFGAVQPT